MDRRKEILSELDQLFGGRWLQMLDALLPVVLYLALDSFFGLRAGIIGAVAAAALIALIRLVRRESLVYVLGGAAGALLAAVLAARSGAGEDFFLPGLVSGGLTVAACTLSVLVNRPLVALTSALVRRWPLAWYRHPKVLPAYNEVTIGWAVAYGLRLALETWLYQRGAATALGGVRIFLGWPFTLALLIGTYLYGIQRLLSLGGPGVQEFVDGRPPPWEGQQRGF